MSRKRRPLSEGGSGTSKRARHASGHEVLSAALCEDSLHPRFNTRFISLIKVLRRIHLKIVVAGKRNSGALGRAKHRNMLRH